MPLQPSTSVLVVDDQPSIRTGLRLLIDSERPRLYSAGSAGCTAEALALARCLRPELVLLDADLGGEDGLALIPMLQRVATCQVVVLTSTATLPVRQRALQLGARACLSKTVPGAELLACLLATIPLNGGGALSCLPGSQLLGDTGKSSDAGHAGVA
ncbi:response regulator [Azohydromonas caseinilytica]|uniref:Response regulator n=1 Tax=Azohydromonas caseinilytica TaxID=2728836 RepID=A0A848F7F4_9BURK|nr:response regulator [Azohydromonas caseinilytica]NML15292.1 response regulator [Azohydromonas caseinilytica]